MVNVFTIFGAFMLMCWALARYGKRPARVLVAFVEWFGKLPKLPVLLAVAAVFVLHRNDADAGIVEFAGGIVGAVGDQFTDVVGGMFEAVRAAILQAIADLICLFIEQFGAFILTIFLGIPDSITGALEAVKPYMDIANSWVPLSDAMAWFASYLIFLIVQIPTKLLIKIFIPTVG